MPNFKTTARTVCAAIFVVAIGTMLLVRPAEAQRTAGDVGIGLQIGDPNGVTLQFYNPAGTSWDFLAAWALDDFFFLNVHALYYRGLGNDRRLHLFYGPGAFVGFRDRGNRDDDVEVGISGTVGIGFMIEQFQIFGAVTPRLAIVPATDGDVGAAIGVRYYF